jgi:hypothetical protein
VNAPRRADVLLPAAAIALVAIGFLASTGLAEAAQVNALRATATVSAILFSAWFIRAEVDESAQRRPGAIAAGASHAVHLGTILAYLSEDWAPKLEPLPTTIAVIGYVAFAALVLLKLRGRTAARIGWFLWFVFTATYLGHASDRPTSSGVAATVMLIVALSRMARTRRNRTSGLAQPR